MHRDEKGRWYDEVEINHFSIIFWYYQSFTAHILASFSFPFPVFAKLLFMFCTRSNNGSTLIYIAQPKVFDKTTSHIVHNVYHGEEYPIYFAFSN